MNKKLISIITLGVFCIASLVGCGKDVSKETVQEKPSKTITFWHHYNAQSAENKILNDIIIPKFNEQYPDINVKAVSHEWAELHKKILVSASSNELPDVARVDIAWVPEFQKLNVLTELNTEISDFDQVANQIIDGPMNTAKINNNFYGLGLNTNTKILFYNKKMFDEYQVKPPTNFEEFFNISRMISNKKSKQQVWGYAEPGLSGWNICPFIWSNGGEITNEDYTKASGYINSKATVKIVEELVKLYNDNAMIGFNNGDIPITDGFGQGRYGMVIDGPWKFAELEGSYPDFEIVTSQMPAGKGGSVQVLGGEDIVMFAKAQKDASWNFMKFMTDEFAQIEMAKGGQIPVNKKAIDSEDVNSIEYFVPFLEAIKTARPRPTVSTWSEIDNELTNSITMAFLGEKSVQECMDELAVKIDQLLVEAHQ